MTTCIETEIKTNLRHMPLFRVIIHNDDKTSMDFVIYILMQYFNKEAQQALEITMEIHNNGLGLAGIYPLEHAEMKVEQTVSEARTAGFPLALTIEEE